MIKLKSDFCNYEKYNLIVRKLTIRSLSGNLKKMLELAIFLDY